MPLKNFYSKGKIEIGCDEAGRGCLAGPVVAAAVILDHKKSHPLLNDSKQVSEKSRIEIEAWIKKNAKAYGIGVVSPEEIDQINILNASFLAMHRAIDQIKPPYDQLLIDGNRFNAYKNVKHHCIIKGDAKFKSIAAASILAKTKRDAIMDELHDYFPEYHWKKNKGYPTKKHREAIQINGPCQWHRKSFQLLAKQLNLDL